MNKTVMVVDDELIEGQLFTRALRKAGFKSEVLIFTGTAKAKCYLRGDPL